jgi:hypothetical protein
MSIDISSQELMHVFSHDELAKQDHTSLRMPQVGSYRAASAMHCADHRRGGNFCASRIAKMTV